MPHIQKNPHLISGFRKSWTETQIKLGLLVFYLNAIKTLLPFQGFERNRSF